LLISDIYYEMIIRKTILQNSLQMATIAQHHQAFEYDFNEC